MNQRDETGPEREAWLRRQVAASRHDPSTPEMAMAWALDEIDRLRRELADARELLVVAQQLVAEQLAREDAARDAAQAWAAYVANWGRGTVERSVEAPLDRLAAAHGLTD